MNDKHFTSRMLTCTGALMTVAAILISVCAKLAYGGILLAAASYMFFAAHDFRIAEDKKVWDEPLLKPAALKRPLWMPSPARNICRKSRFACIIWSESTNLQRAVL